MGRLAALALAASSALAAARGAVAQQADPYADAYQAGRLAQYKAQREGYLKDAENVAWAYGCKVLPNDVAITFILNADATGMDPTIIDTHVAGMRSEALQRGLAKARDAGGCKHWHEHPDEVLAVRQRALAAAR